jgi:hypothetical protein
VRAIRLIGPALGLSLLALAGPASAAAPAAHATRPTGTSADAGYAVSGKELTVAETWVTLPRPSRFAREAGTVAASVQLWTSGEVIDLRMAACTDKSCRAGGRPSTEYYRPVLDVYNRATRALICSSSGRGPASCDGQALGPFGRARYRAGTNVALSLVYVIPYTSVMAQAGNQDYIYNLPVNPSSKPHLDFTEARIVAEFGASPWSRPDLRAPAAETAVMSFDRPAPPPYAAEIADFAGKAGGIAQSWWRHSRVTAHPGPGYATAGSLWDDGYGFTVYLKR